MATSKKKPKTTRWYRGDTDFDELDPCEQIAHRIVESYGDIAPSVDRIMTADLSAEQRLEAMTLFQSSLGQVGDPHRDPRTAIETARATPGR